MREQKMAKKTVLTAFQKMEIRWDFIHSADQSTRLGCQSTCLGCALTVRGAQEAKTH